MNSEIDRDLRVLLVGSGSMLGAALMAQTKPGLILTGIGHTQFADISPGEYDIVINMAYDPRYMREVYDQALDYDLRVAQAAAAAGCHFVMVSTRKVYGPTLQFPLPETAPEAPTDNYGRNKLETERRVASLLGPDCTVLRLSNVFDFEPNRHTFFGAALTSLRRDGRIVLDVNPFVKKDFIPLQDCASAIMAVLAHRPSGKFNVGYGTATQIGRIATWLIEGYGRGELVVTSTEERDEFLLDISKLTNLIGQPQCRQSIRDCCLQLGERLRHA